MQKSTIDTVNHDTLHRFLFEASPVRGNLVHLNLSFQQALQHQTLPHGLKCALGELMAASTLLAATLKMQGSLIMQIQSKGILKLLVVECTSDFAIRATAKFSDEIADQATLPELLDQGQFVITIDPKDGKQQAYQGIVPLEGDSISMILENYMIRSEQIETRIWLSCDGSSAAGMLLQKLPDTMNQLTASETQQADYLETWNRVGMLANTITDAELLNLDSETILTRLFHEEQVRLFEPNHTKFFCSCTRNSVANMLRMLGADEINSIIEEQHQIEVNCDFCNQHYVFDEVDAKQLVLSETTPNTNQNIH